MSAPLQLACVPCCSWKRSCLPLLEAPSRSRLSFWGFPVHPPPSYNRGTDTGGGSGWSLSAQLLGFFIFLNRSLSLLKASLTLLQTCGLSCFQILTSLWSHPTENTDWTDVQTSDCYIRQGFSVIKYILSKRSAFLEDKLWGPKGSTSAFALMESTSCQMNENPWAVWSESSQQQPLSSLGKHLSARASFLRHNFVASGLWNLDESYHLFCITWGPSWVF